MDQEIEGLLETYERVWDALEFAVGNKLPPESVCVSTEHSGQFAICVFRGGVEHPYLVRCQLENYSVVEWHVRGLVPNRNRKEWPSWVRKQLTERKRQKARNL